MPDEQTAAATIPITSPTQREAAVHERRPLPRAVDASLARRVADATENLALSPSQLGFVAETLQEAAERRARLVARWRSAAGQAGADAELRAGLDELSSWRRLTLQGELGTALGAVVAARLQDSAARRPPEQRSPSAVATGARR